MSEIEKCRTCKHFEPFFYSCNLYEREVYMDEGDFNLQHVSIKEVDETECEYVKQQVKGILE